MVILLSIIFLFIVIPLLWAILVVLAKVLAWHGDKGFRKPLGARAWRAFKRGYWSAFWWIAGLTVLGLILWLIFKD